MKKLAVLGAGTGIVLLCLSSCASPAKIGKAEIIEHQGTKIGKDVPPWVNAMINGNSGEISRALGISERRNKVWTQIGTGADLETLRIETELSVKAFIASSISETIDLRATKRLNDIQSVSEKEKTNTLDTITRSFSTVTFRGLERVGSYWIKTRTPLVSKPESIDDYAIRYDYYLVYTMPYDRLERQIAEVMKANSHFRRNKIPKKDAARRRRLPRAS